MTMPLYRFTLAAAVFLAAPQALAGDLRSAFYALPKADRMILQERLSEPGLYQGVVDGLWGPGTANAVAQAQQSLAWPGYRDTARDAGLTDPGATLWAYILDDDFVASLPSKR